MDGCIYRGGERDVKLIMIMVKKQVKIKPGNLSGIKDQRRRRRRKKKRKERKKKRRKKEENEDEKQKQKRARTRKRVETKSPE